MPGLSMWHLVVLLVLLALVVVAIFFIARAARGGFNRRIERIVDAKLNERDAKK